MSTMPQECVGDSVALLSVTKILVHRGKVFVFRA